MGIDTTCGGTRYENSYLVLELPADKKPATQHSEPGAWLPSRAEIDGLKLLLDIQEGSERTLLHIYGRDMERVTLDRQYVAGCHCLPWHCPLETFVRQGQQMLGRVDQDSGSCCLVFWEQNCLLQNTFKVLVGPSRDSLVHKYSLVHTAGCCGRVNNCCGGTGCRPNLLIDVVEPGGGGLAGVIQQTYGLGGFDGPHNYVLPFPRDATSTERAMLLAGLLSLDMTFSYESSGVDK